MALPFNYKQNIRNMLARTGGTVKRNNVTKIIWKRLDNSIWKKLRAFNKNEFENFNLLLQTEEKDKESFVNEYYVESFLKFLFGDLDFRKEFMESNPKILNRIQTTSRKLIDWDAAVEIFARKKTHKAMKKLIETRFGKDKYAVCILNGDETTNLECEKKAKNFIEQNKNKRIVFIADGMGIRSFSVKKIKNIVLMIDGSNYGTLMQRIGRGLTENKEHNTCKIIDFRTISNPEGMCGEFITGHVERKAREKGKSISDIIGDIDFNQIMFEDYFNNDFYSGSPIRVMTSEEIKNVIAQSNFIKKSLVNTFSNLDSDLIKECLKVVSKIDCSKWSKSKPEKVTMQITTNVNNAHGGKINIGCGIKPKKSEDGKKAELNDKEKAINFHLAWFANNYAYIFANYALRFNNHILKNAFETRELDNSLKKDFNLDMRILKVIINNVDKLFYDIIDQEFIKLNAF